MVPLRDSVTITPGSTLDKWGQSTAGTPVVYKCRITEGTKLVRNQGPDGQKVESDTQILLKNIVAVDYDDDVTWTDSMGVTRTRKPIGISTLKNYGGKVLFTRIDV